MGDWRGETPTGFEPHKAGPPPVHERVEVEGAFLVQDG